MSEVENLFKTWASQGSYYLGECFDLSKPFLDQDYKGIDPHVRFVSAQLYIDCHLTSESVFLLIQQGKEWDADILVRSVMEGTIKYIYILDGSQEEAHKKATEFWHVLPSFSDIKHSFRAQKFLEEVPSDENNKRPFRDLILDDYQIDEIRGSCSRQERVELEKKWSFTGLINSFSNSENKSLRLLVHLAHGYGMSSHLLHKDGVGVSIVWDRFRRDPLRQSAARLGHASRIVSDICTFSILRLLFLLKFCKQDITCIKTLSNKYKELFEALTESTNYFNHIEYGSE